MKILNTAAALIALSQAQIAHAQQVKCVAQEDMTAASIYAMPLIVEAAQETCRPHLAANGFLARNGAAFAKPYRAYQSRNWPATLRVLDAYGASPQVKKATGQADLGALTGFLRNQSPELARPFVDLSVKSLVRSKIRTEDCARIERGMELLAPLPPENAGGIVTLILDVAETDGPKLCPIKRK